MGVDEGELGHAEKSSRRERRPLNDAIPSPIVARNRSSVRRRPMLARAK
jgi:hypothetical protein